MLVYLSIVDKHREGDGFVGVTVVEVNLPNNSHFDVIAVVVPLEFEAQYRNAIGRVMTSKEEVAFVLQEEVYYGTGELAATPKRNQ